MKVLFVMIQYCDPLARRAMFALHTLWVLALLIQSPRTQGQDSSTSGGILRFNENEWIAGTLVEVPSGETLLWKSSDFCEPLSIRIASVWQLLNTAEPAPALTISASTITTAMVQVDLIDGGAIVGELLRRSDSGLSIRSDSLGSIEIPNDRWLQYIPLQGSESVRPIAPTRSLASMFESSQVPSGWERTSDSFSSTIPAATLRGDFSLTDRFRVDLRLAWIGKPSFDIAIGINPDEPSASTAVHLEVWDGMLVLARQQGGKADTSSIKNLLAGEPMVELTIFHDSRNGVTTANDLQGNELARISLPSTLSSRNTGIQVVNHGDGLRIESLRTSRWLEGELAKPVVNTLVEASEASEIVDSQRVLLVTTTDGSRLSGRFSKGIKGSPVFEAFAIPAPLTIALSSIHRITGIYQKPAMKSSGTLPFILSTKRSQWHVNMETFQRKNEIELFAIQSPYLSQGASLAAGTSGEMFIPSQALEEVMLKPAVALKGPGSVLNKFTKPLQASDYRIASLITLRNGEALQGQVSKIDEIGVHFSSKLTDSTLLKPEDVKSIHLHPRSYSTLIDAEKMERLTTIPRNQVDDAPKNLLVTTSGDYLRGSLIALTDTKVEYIIKDEVLNFPLHQVSSIVWLFERSWEHETATVVASRIDSGLPSNEVAIHYYSDAKNIDGFTSIVIDSADANFVLGRSDLIGLVDLPVRSIARLSFGSDVYRSQFNRPNPWRLMAAKAPTVLEPNDGDPSTDQPRVDNSSLIGKQAPAFQLKKLDGNPLRLDSLRGKVLVLDFWASWCGPCIESLPEVQQLAKSFGNDRCAWLGINVQESREQAANIADRLGIDETILLDSDGDVAVLYEATAFPMIVIINQQGIVHRVFIGMENARIEQVRKAIDECLNR